MFSHIKQLEFSDKQTCHWHGSVYGGGDGGGTACLHRFTTLGSPPRVKSKEIQQCYLKHTKGINWYKLKLTV